MRSFFSVCFEVAVRGSKSQQLTRCMQSKSVVTIYLLFDMASSLPPVFMNTKDILKIES